MRSSPSARGVLTLFMVWSLVLLITALPAHKGAAGHAAAIIGGVVVTNVLVFRVVYWRLDAGGPYARSQAGGSSQRIVPVSADDAQRGRRRGQWANWSPIFIDYIPGVQHSTAFSPTDAARALALGKVLMMAQSIISLTVLAVLAARAITFSEMPFRTQSNRFRGLPNDSYTFIRFARGLTVEASHVHAGLRAICARDLHGNRINRVHRPGSGYLGSISIPLTLALSFDAREQIVISRRCSPSR